MRFVEVKHSESLRTANMQNRIVVQGGYSEMAVIQMYFKHV
jgi:hypothetical protein